MILYKIQDFPSSYKDAAYPSIPQTILVLALTSYSV